MDILQTILNSHIVQSNTVNFIIMVIILGAIVKKCSLGGKLDDSIKNKEKEIQLSKDENVKAKEILKVTKEDYAKLGDEVNQLKEDTKLKIENLNKEINDTSEVMLKHIDDNTNKSIIAEDKKISAQVTDETMCDASEIAKENIIKKLENNMELHAQLIEKSIEELMGAKL